MSEATLLGIDLGTSAVKAILVTKAGQVVGAGSAEYPIAHPQPGHAEQNPEDWWQAVVVAVRQAVGLATAPLKVAAIGLSGQMHGTVLLDQRGGVLAPAVIWPDQRSSRQVQEITELIGAERLIDLAGSPLATGFQAATVRWFQQNQPDIWRWVRTILLPKDYVRWWLTAEFVSDPSDGSGALLLDVQRRAWSHEILDILGIEPTQLPPLQPSSALAGELVRAAAEKLGLSPGIPIVTGAADTACSMLGAGVVDANRLLLTLSTGGQLVLPAQEVTVDRRGRIHTFCSALEPGHGHSAWYQMGAILSAGLALRWLRDQVFGWHSEDAYARMTALAAQAPVGAAGLIFLPYLVGERTPHMDPHARGLFWGLTLRHGQPELVRAVLEGVALACYDAYRVLAEVSPAPDEIILAGGGARSALWRQIIADVFGTPLRPLHVMEQSAMGAALLAGVGMGWFEPVQTAHAWASYGEPVTPNPAHHSRYQEVFATFLKLYRPFRVESLRDEQENSTQRR